MFTAAIDSAPRSADSRASTSAPRTLHQQHPARPAAPAHRLAAQRATTRAPSSSDSAPATTAAAISPCEWPTTAAGLDAERAPQPASDTITAQATARLHHVHAIRQAEGLRRLTARAVDKTDQPVHATAPQRTRARRICSANTGDASSSSPAIPAHCEPWPGNTNTDLARASAATPLHQRRRSRRPSASAASACTHAAGPDASTTARCSKRGAAQRQPAHRRRPSRARRVPRASRARRRGLGAQRRSVAAGHQPAATPGRDRRARWPPRRLALPAPASEDHVRVGAADPERRHPGPARRAGLAATAAASVSSRHRARRPVDVRRRLVDVQRLRQHAVPQRHAPS